MTLRMFPVRTKSIGPDTRPCMNGSCEKTVVIYRSTLETQKNESLSFPQESYITHPPINIFPKKNKV